MNSSKTTMSVPEMRKLLGLKKTDSYWLVHRNFFETKIIGGKMRIDVRSFEKWYANQVKHKKVNGEPPGTAALAGVTTATITKWIGMDRFAYIGAGKVLRICRKEFLEWLKEYQKGGA